MSTPIFITVYSNGDIWLSKEVNFVAPASEAGTVVKHFRCSSEFTGKITTLTGSGNGNAGALAASGGSTTRHGKSGLDTEDFL